MRIAKRPLVIALSSVALLSMLTTVVVITKTGNAQAATMRGTTRLISQAATATFTGTAQGTASGIQKPEFPASAYGDSADAGGTGTFGGVNRSNSGATRGNGHAVNSNGTAKSNPKLSTTFDGLNFYDQRYANGGNQWSVEPPDQGMCAGSGYIFESVNDVARVFNTAGTPLTGVMDLNTFYGYQAAINRHTGQQGAFVTDPSCLYDASTQRFFNTVLTIDVDPSTGNFIGTNHIDIAVSNTSNPAGAWTIYRLPVQDDGTQGTPNHNCVGGPCFGDYPHIGADANGFYVTTNEYDFFGNGFHGAQVYAFSKTALASLAPTVAVTQFDTATSAPGGKPGFTLWAAQTPGDQFDDANGGMEYFLSSTAADEAQCPSEAQGCSSTHQSSNILLWSLSGTQSLNSTTPTLSLVNSSISVDQYAMPPKSNQPATGDWPLGQCLNDAGCAPIFLGQADPFTETISHLDSNDTRMQQVMYANGEVWGALDTDVIVNGVHEAGIEYFIVNPHSGKLALQGTLALAGNNLTYPAIGVTSSGRGVMAFTVVGNDYYPSAGYASIDNKMGAGDVHIAAAGKGLDDGFTGYAAIVGNPPRTRWGDYGAAAVDGNSVWITSEYIGQSCTLAEYLTPPYFTCGGTRGAFGNWDTRISKVTP